MAISRFGRRRPVSKRGTRQTAEDVRALTAACTADVEREFAASQLDAGEMRAEIILRMRYAHDCTWAQIGEGLGLTGERARQLHRDTLRTRARREFGDLLRQHAAPMESLPAARRARDDD